MQRDVWYQRSCSLFHMQLQEKMAPQSRMNDKTATDCIPEDPLEHMYGNRNRGRNRFSPLVYLEVSSGSSPDPAMLIVVFFKGAYNENRSSNVLALSLD